MCCGCDIKKIVIKATFLSFCNRWYVWEFLLFSCEKIYLVEFSLFGQGSQDPILAVEFHPSEPNSIIDVGKGHIQFWNLESGKLTKKNGVFDVSITTWQIYIYIYWYHHCFFDKYIYILISSLFFLQIYIYILISSLFFLPLFQYQGNLSKVALWRLVLPSINKYIWHYHKRTSVENGSRASFNHPNYYVWVLFVTSREDIIYQSINLIFFVFTEIWQA